MIGDAPQVRRRRRAQPGQAGVGQDRLGTARIGDAGVALDEAVSDQPIDEARHAALAQQHLVGELAHADPASRRRRDGQQGVVLGEREVVLRAQLVVESAGDAGVRHEERPPWGEARVVGRQWPCGCPGNSHRRW